MGWPKCYISIYDTTGNSPFSGYRYILWMALDYISCSLFFFLPLIYEPIRWIYRIEFPSRSRNRIWQSVFVRSRKLYISLDSPVYSVLPGSVGGTLTVTCRQGAIRGPASSGSLQVRGDSRGPVFGNATLEHIQRTHCVSGYIGIEKCETARADKYVYCINLYTPRWTTGMTLSHMTRAVFHYGWTKVHKNNRCAAIYKDTSSLRGPVSWPWYRKDTYVGGMRTCQIYLSSGICGLSRPGFRQVTLPCSWQETVFLWHLQDIFCARVFVD